MTTGRINQVAPSGPGPAARPAGAGALRTARPRRGCRAAAPESLALSAALGRARAPSGPPAASRSLPLSPAGGRGPPAVRLLLSPRSRRAAGREVRLGSARRPCGTRLGPPPSSAGAEPRLVGPPPPRRGAGPAGRARLGDRPAGGSSGSRGRVRRRALTACRGCRDPAGGRGRPAAEGGPAPALPVQRRADPSAPPTGGRLRTTAWGGS